MRCGVVVCEADVGRRGAVCSVAGVPTGSLAIFQGRKEKGGRRGIGEGRRKKKEGGGESRE